MFEYINQITLAVLDHISGVDAVLVILVLFYFLLPIISLRIQDLTDRKAKLIDKGMNNIRIFIYIFFGLRVGVVVYQLIDKALNFYLKCK